MHMGMIPMSSTSLATINVPHIIQTLAEGNGTGDIVGIACSNDVQAVSV